MLKSIQNKMKNLISKIGKIILLLVTLITSGLSGYKGVKAIETNAVELHVKSTYGNMLKYGGKEITTNFVVYNKNGTEYPVYQTNPNKQCVDTNGSYVIKSTKPLNDVELWKVVICGYPYRSEKVLKCNSIEEAYTATEQAILCQKYGRTPDEYEAIGEAGERVKNAMKNILNYVQYKHNYNSELKISSEQGEFVKDDVDNNYRSQTFNISTGYSIEDLKLSLEGNYPLGTKIVNALNEEIKEYTGLTSFKVIYPFKSATESGSFQIKAVATTYSYPVVYGTAYRLVLTRSAMQDTEIQDYILTDSILGDSEANITLNYNQNETKITIIKKDKANNKPLEGVRFRLLDMDKNPVYTDLVTNSEGEIVIENILPGRYYLEETETLEGYVKYDDLIFIELSANQSATVTVKNSKKNDQTFNENNSNITVDKEESNNNIVENEENINISDKNENTNEQVTNTNTNTNTNINQNNSIVKLPKTGM